MKEYACYVQVYGEEATKRWTSARAVVCEGRQVIKATMLHQRYDSQAEAWRKAILDSVQFMTSQKPKDRVVVVVPELVLLTLEVQGLKELLRDHGNADVEYRVASLGGRVHHDHALAEARATYDAAKAAAKKARETPTTTDKAVTT